MNIGPDRLPYVEDKRWTIYHLSFHVQWCVVLFLSKRLKTYRLCWDHFSVVLDASDAVYIWDCTAPAEPILSLLMQPGINCTYFPGIQVNNSTIQSSACTRSLNNRFLFSCLNYICDPPHVWRPRKLMQCTFPLNICLHPISCIYLSECLQKNVCRSCVFRYEGST